MAQTALRAHSLVAATFFIMAVVFYSPHYALSVFSGALLMGFNLAVLIWTWGQIIQKKSVALAATAIVFKYAILAIVIVQLLSRDLVHPIGFFVGLSTLLPTLGWLAFKEHERLKTYG